MNKNKKIKWIIGVLVIIIIVFGAMIAFSQYAHLQYHRELVYKVRTLATGFQNLASLIELQDRTFQEAGEFKSIQPHDDLTYIESFNHCNEGCTPCEYAVVVSGQSFTATAKCEGRDGTPNFTGYVRVPPGQHRGIDGYYGKCTSDGVFAGNRHLVNTIGPCTKQDNGLRSIVSGIKKRLVIETLPPDVDITINSKVIGRTSESHNATTSSYGSLFISDPVVDTNIVTLSKPGYTPITYQLDWGSYTYKSTVILDKASQ